MIELKEWTWEIYKNKASFILVSYTKYTVLVIDKVLSESFV